jgi:tRNA pseudouridine55 synthase
MRLGIETASYDIDGEVVESRPVPDVDLDAINAACARYVGEIDQLPPMVSAVKVGGERLYRLARRGETVERPVRRVVVHRFEAVAFQSPDVTVQVRCASGCYVRTLCHDVGQDLGCGAMLAALRRTEVGDRSVSDALPVDAFETPEQVRDRLIPMDTALTLPAVRVNESGRTVVTNGGMLFASHLAGGDPVGEGWVQVHSGRGHLLALGTAEPSAMGPRIRLRRVFG